MIRLPKLFAGVAFAVALCGSAFAQQPGPGPAPSSGATGDNPSASAGLSAVNGSATTFIRSDGAPAISQAIAPTWSATHTFTLAPIFTDQSGTRTALGLGTSATVNTGTSGATVPLLNGANTHSGATTFSAAVADTVAGATSTAAHIFSGAILTGGSGTTNFPHIFRQPTGATAATTWSTSGTSFGVNEATGFAGNLEDFRVGGVNKYTVTSAGNVSAVGRIWAGGSTNSSCSATGICSDGNVVLGTTASIRWDNRGSMATTGVNVWQFQNSAGTAGFLLHTYTTNGAETSVGLCDFDSATPATCSVTTTDVATGTSNGAGSDLTISGSAGTGTGVGGPIKLRTAPHGSTGTAKNAQVTGFLLDEASHVTLGATIPTCGTGCSSIATGGTDHRMAITSGAAVTAVTVNFAKTWLNSVAPVCVASTSNSTDIPSISAVSTTAVTVTLSAVITGTVYLLCG